MQSRNIRICHVNESDMQRGVNAIPQISSKSFWKKRNFQFKSSAWKILKIFIIIISLGCMLFQSVTFINHYYTYPTGTRITAYSPKDFKAPCITLCNNNVIRRSKFCSEYPHLCISPKNITEYCLKYPHICSKGRSNIVIPNRKWCSEEYYGDDSIIDMDTELKIQDAIKHLYENRNSMKEPWSKWTWDMPADKVYEREMIATISYNFDDIGYITCFSKNLQYSNEFPALTWPTEFNGRWPFEGFFLNLEEHEAFCPRKIPQVIFAVHSPFYPISPMQEGIALKIGHEYIVNVKLEEEHLLPHPYKTDCVDYDALWRKNNKTGPRSQKDCKQLCLWSHFTECKELPNEAPMIQLSKNMCEVNSKNHLDVKECQKNCKADCVILKYSFKFTEVDKRKGFISNPADEGNIGIAVYLEDPEIAVMAHIPLYEEGDLFSNIGGLMGCWLGVSVATFMGLLETTFSGLIHFKTKLGRYLKSKGRRVGAKTDRTRVFHA